MELVEVEKLRISRSKDTTPFVTESVVFRLGDLSPFSHNKLHSLLFLSNPLSQGSFTRSDLVPVSRLAGCCC